jgi:hypothetical protein
MIDGAREPETWLDRRPRGNHIAGWRRAKKKKRRTSRRQLSSSSHVKATLNNNNNNNKRRRPTRKTTLVSWVSRYHRHFVRLRLSLLASQGESELPEVASQRSDERTHILITFGLWQHRVAAACSPRLVSSGMYICMRGWRVKG